MIDLQTLLADEAERIAYAEGFTGTAALFARIVDLEAERDRLHYEKTQAHETAESLRDTLYFALPFVEDHEGSDIYKPAYLKTVLNRIRAALGEDPIK